MFDDFGAVFNEKLQKTTDTKSDKGNERMRKIAEGRLQCRTRQIKKTIELQS